MQCEICENWAREHGNCYPKLKGKDIHFVITDHHISCPHYNDSLIDVWKIEYDGEACYSDREPDSDCLEEGIKVTKEKMHREVYDQLPEFEGF